MHYLKVETAGIQKYIFGTNKLKVNLGASYIIEHLLFKELFKNCIQEEFSKEYTDIIDDWYEKNFTDQLTSGDDDFKLGYIGGGNIVLFGNRKNLEMIDALFKKYVLMYFPGMEIYSAIIEEQGGYKETMKRLTEKVNEQRTEKAFINYTFNHGFYNKCRVSGGVASHYWKAESVWVSDEVMSKVQYCEGENPANKQHENDLLSDVQREKYTFPLNFENLSQKTDKSYIAIVHIDGNNFGQAFIDAKNLEETQNLSRMVRELGTLSLKKTIQEGVIGKIENNEFEDDFIKYREDGVKFLPIRPIITGGDDITFVCEGTLGIPLAVSFLRNFHAIGKEMNLLGGNVHACAGVAIVKQKYPFYRGYKLSEELIKEAKKVSRKKTGSYLSAMVAGYGTGTSLRDLREKFAKPELYNDAYCVVGEAGVTSIEELENMIAIFTEERKGARVVPRNKLMDIRHALVTDTIDFVWPVVNSRLNRSDLNPMVKERLVFEAIELMDFYHPAFISQL